MAFGKTDSSGLPQGTWLGGHYLGKGGDGTLHYWTKVGENRKIIDRMVIKDLYSRESTMEPSEYRAIYDDLVAKGMDFGAVAPGSSGPSLPEQRFFREAYLQALFTDPSGASTYTVPLRGYKRGHSDTGRGTHWRVYMDLLHAGDLENFMRKHNDADGESIPFPEPFIWWTLYCLAKALVDLDQRVQTKLGPRSAEGEVVVMIDMKLPNMLLDAKRGSEYPLYPKPLVSDFGSAHILHKADPRSKKGGIKLHATDGYWAPEMDVIEGVDRAINEPLHSWTNVWQAGRVIEFMMVKASTANEGTYGDSNIKKYPPEFDEFPNFRYSNELIEIVWRCQLFDPKAQPTPAELLLYIEQHAPALNKGMDTWGSANWIAAQKLIKGAPTFVEVIGRDERIRKRIRSGKLSFLKNFEDQALAKEYANLEMDPPDDCLLAYQGGADPARLGMEGKEPVAGDDADW
ncbi:hypothetical protein AUEXF2481DRAFT_296868 [Aureobasidium subglaciale EXF-2481]|uniref:Protein kinase domain-containing protein n=1 Tax=Aureobasidium subglaciale (strain EXF-2481) TaxID=1043005 RepID=A0A074Z5J9_AURSE|nr:uncharacterized protein AUEXF2481DRAFT_296868 [Aureobasidium subglaciale EXF-2481]KAI5227295.1 hypothetical protein E4T40_02747 [Aureobasidium subglaciale]KEQ94211.1 hypothetical protein AUEXF2481DRAFT_296868 [Aureobasidium subglaciale EXF-2481]